MTLRTKRKTRTESQSMKTKEDSTNVGLSTASGTDTPALPAVVDRATFQAELDALRVRENAHTREGDAIAAARRRLPTIPAPPGADRQGGGSYDERRAWPHASRAGVPTPLRPQRPGP